MKAQAKIRIAENDKLEPMPTMLDNRILLIKDAHDPIFRSSLSFENDAALDDMIVALKRLKNMTRKQEAS